MRTIAGGGEVQGITNDLPGGGVMAIGQERFEDLHHFFLVARLARLVYYVIVNHTNWEWPEYSNWQWPELDTI